MSELSCQEQFYSDDYYDFIAEVDRILESGQSFINYSCIQRVNDQYDVILLPRDENPPLTLSNYPYIVIPKCYGLSNTQALEASGIYTMQQYPGLNLSGEGVILGFIDSGIDYRNDCFKDINGRTRIAAIWDQSIASEKNPPNFLFGTEYLEEDINNALSSADPFTVVPSTDIRGHGTITASVAAGSSIPSEDFIGAANKSLIAMVKLKEAKPHLRQFYNITTDEACYSESDIILGINYLQQLAIRLKKPLVICIGLESNLGDHNGGTPLGVIVDSIGKQRLRSVVFSTGNEGNRRHHYEGTIDVGQDSEDVEIRVDLVSGGFTLELWATTPDLFSVAVISPSGEELPRIPVIRNISITHTFLFEQTVLNLEYQFSSVIGGDQLIQMRFNRPTPGIWTIRTFINNRILGRYNMWLPIEAFLDGNVYFIRSTPQMTISSPSTTERAITTGGYNSINNSISIDSGRGYTRTGKIKPDFASPSVNVYVGLINNAFGLRSGGSIAAALAAGAAAMLMEWAVTLGNAPLIEASEIRTLLIRGASEDNSRSYPNQEWGYGTLDLYQSFLNLRVY